MEEKEKILRYINDNFEIDSISYRLIESIYDYFYFNNISKDIITYNDNKIAINSFLYKLLDILNDSYIDITMQELLGFNLIDMECM